jgi:hypothetical protein
MSLEDDLKAKALALVSQQMAGWVVEIQRQIAAHQGNIVRQLDELQETVARYDERIDESEIGRAIAKVVADNPAPPPPPPPPSGPGMDTLKAALARVDKGSTLSEVLTYLVDEVQQHVERVAMFIVKGTNAVGWYARGVQPADAIKHVQVPLGADTLFRLVQNGRHALRGHVTHSPGTAQALARLGGTPQGLLAVPLVLRDKLAAILYCDTQQEEVPSAQADLIEILVQSAGKTIDILSLAPKPAAPAAARTTSGNTAERAAAIRAGGDEVRERAGLPPARPAAAPPPPPPPAPTAAAADADGASTVMFRPGALPRPAAAPPPPAATAASPEDQKVHDEAKRFARLVVSEIKLYNEAKVSEGRRQRDLYERLKEDIERGRQMYHDRVAAHVRDSTNYFYDELVRILAGGDASALGPM